MTSIALGTVLVVALAGRRRPRSWTRGQKLFQAGDVAGP
jgi:hypothetical protein